MGQQELENVVLSARSVQIRGHKSGPATAVSKGFGVEVGVPGW